MDFISEKWDEITDKMRNEFNISNVSFETWIKPLKECCVKEDVVYIIIPDVNAGMSEYINSKYKSLFQVTISEMFDHTYNVEFVIEKDVSSLLKGEEFTTPSPVYNINYEAANLNPKYKFDTFVVGSNNKFAHSACLAVAESPGKAYNPLYLYGGAGLGKTHLMHSIGHFLLEKDSDTKVLYVTSEEFTNEVIESIRSGNAAAMTKLRDKYRTVDVLMVDDVQFIIGKESTQDEFFHTFNTLREAKKQVIISSDRPPKDFETLEDRLKSRFTNGLLVDISPPNYETRMAILHKKGEIEGYNIDMDVLEYIATNIKSNIRELEGSLTKLVAFSKFSKKPINVSLAEEVLRDFISPNAHREVTPELIIQTVAEHYQISVEDLISKKRDQKIAWPRQIAMYLCRSLTDIPLTKIGSYLGDRDHTTVSHGCDKVAETLAKDASFANTLDIIKKKINPS